MFTALSFVLTGIFIGIDQYTKYLAGHFLKEQPLVVWRGVFELRYCENTGVAFSMLENQRWLFIPTTVLAMIFVLILLWRSPLCRHAVFRFSMILILAGGIGNLIDRTVYGFVVDFLYVKLIDFPIFNFADCCVVIGAVLLFIYFLFLFREPEDRPLKTLLFGLPVEKKWADTHGSDTDTAG